MLEGWGGFEDDETEMTFDEDWGQCVRVREETNRHVNQVTRTTILHPLRSGFLRETVVHNRSPSEIPT